MSFARSIPSRCLSLLQRLSKFATAPQEISAGVTSFKDMRFFLVLALYLGSVILLARDSFFIQYGDFTWKQPLLVIAISFLVVTTVNWELLLTGKPQGANLLLQCIMLIPFTLFIARILGQPVNDQPFNLSQSVLDLIQKNAHYIIPNFLAKILDWIAGFFTNIWLLVLILILEAALCFKQRQIKIAVLVIFVFSIFAYTLSDPYPKTYFLLGGAVFFTGFAFHYCNYARLMYFENIAAILPHENDSRIYEILLRTMNLIYSSGKMEERQFLQNVKSVYSPAGEYNEHEVRVIAGELTRKMIYEYPLITINGSQNGYFAIPRQDLYLCSSPLRMISMLPRVIIIALLALAWLASPIDLIPDFLPFGGLDDIIVTLLSTMVAQRSMRSIPADMPEQH